MESNLYFYEEGKSYVIDKVDPFTGRSSLRGKTIDELKVDYPNVRIITYEQVQEKINEVLKEMYPLLEPKEITEKEFYEMFECLPPLHYIHGFKGMTFKLEEMTYGDITSGFVHLRSNDKYYQMNVRYKTTHDEMVNATNFSIKLNG